MPEERGYIVKQGLLKGMIKSLSANPVQRYRDEQQKRHCPQQPQIIADLRYTAGSRDTEFYRRGGEKLLQKWLRERVMLKRWLIFCAQ